MSERYYFHLRQGRYFIVDAEGTIFSSEEGARAGALEAAASGLEIKGLLDRIPTGGIVEITSGNATVIGLVLMKART